MSRLQADSDPADYYNGKDHKITLVEYVDQTITYGEISNPITVRITDPSGTPLVNAPVSITLPDKEVAGAQLSLHADGSNSDTTIRGARSNAQGEVTYYYIMPTSPQ